MRKSNKKKGSSLIVVVIIMGILFTTGTAILSVSASDYKMRINESKNLQNLYKSDSGLDVVYNVIVKNSEAAISYADNKVIEKYKDKSVTAGMGEDINNSFKAYFIEFLGESALDKGGKDTDATLAQGIYTRKYKVTSDDGKTFTWKEYIGNEAVIEIKSYSYSPTEKKIVIEVKSTFKNNNGELENKKTISTKYEVQAPDYQKTIVSESKNVEIGLYPVFNQKAITADGNMTVEGTAKVNGTANITGDIWIKGDYNLRSNPSYTFDKYKGGIAINNGDLKITGNISTANTLHLKNNSEATINGDVYALNAYVGKDSSQNASIDNNLIIKKNLIVNNDLALNAKKSRILVENNFYGINDKTEPNADTAQKALKSSSIIVNETDNESSLTVNKDSYIMGVAYIDAADEQGNRYQTGESVAVKGNYLAYNDVLSGYADKVTLKYYNPLQLIDTINGVDSVEAKAEYISAYFKDPSTLKNGGVDLKGSVHSVGAYIKDAKLQYSGWNADSQITDKRNEFAKNVFAMGDTNGIVTNTIYNDGKVLKTVETQIDFTKIPQTVQLDETHGKVILSNNDIVIENNKINNVTVDKGLIITSGNVTLKDGVNFTGTIIAKGNVIFEGTSENKITYNDDLIKKLIASNYSILEPIFKGSEINKTNVNIGEEVKFEGSSNGYELSKFIISKQWKIEK